MSKLNKTELQLNVTVSLFRKAVGSGGKTTKNYVQKSTSVNAVALKE